MDCGYSSTVYCHARGRCYLLRSPPPPCHYSILASPGAAALSECCLRPVRAPKPSTSSRRPGAARLALCSAWRLPPVALAMDFAMALLPLCYGKLAMLHLDYLLLGQRMVDAVRQKPEKPRRGTSLTAFGSSPATRSPAPCELASTTLDDLLPWRSTVPALDVPPHAHRQQCDPCLHSSLIALPAVAFTFTQPMLQPLASFSAACPKYSIDLHCLYPYSCPL